MSPIERRRDRIIAFFWPLAFVSSVWLAFHILRHFGWFWGVAVWFCLGVPAAVFLAAVVCGFITCLFCEPWLGKSSDQIPQKVRVRGVRGKIYHDPPSRN